jgi:hypothetical protein
MPVSGSTASVCVPLLGFSPVDVYSPQMGLLRIFAKGSSLAVSVAMSSCVATGDASHTTATTVVPPPPRQELRIVVKPPPTTTGVVTKPLDGSLHADPRKPLLLVNLKDGQTFHVGDDVLIDFAVANAKLKGDGGDYRVRYIIDDGEMQWIDQPQPLWLAGWLPGDHTIRLELIGPDGWPYQNGTANIVTRKIVVTK